MFLLSSTAICCGDFQPCCTVCKYSAHNKQSVSGLVVSNPPYNGVIAKNVGENINARGISTLISHAGNFGDALTRPILAKLPNLLTDQGISCIVSIWLLKGNLLAYENTEFMAKNGTSFFNGYIWIK